MGLRLDRTTAVSESSVAGWGLRECEAAFVLIQNAVGRRCGIELVGTQVGGANSRSRTNGPCPIG